MGRAKVHGWCLRKISVESLALLLSKTEVSALLSFDKICSNCTVLAINQPVVQQLVSLEAFTKSYPEGTSWILFFQLFEKKLTFLAQITCDSLEKSIN
jgi:hypothetical protein